MLIHLPQLPVNVCVLGVLGFIIRLRERFIYFSNLDVPLYFAAQVAKHDLDLSIPRKFELEDERDPRLLEILQSNMFDQIILLTAANDQVESYAMKSVGAMASQWHSSLFRTNIK